MSPPGERVRDPWFCLPVLVCMLTDAVVSLACQPAAYWSDPASLQEGNVAWAVLLARGPGVFLGGFLLYCLVIAGLLVWLRGALQKLLGMFVLLAHSYGAASWLHVELPDRAYWWGLIGLLLLEALAFTVYWHLSPLCDRRRGHAGREGARGRRAAARTSMTFLASGRLAECLASLQERHPMTALQDSARSQLTLRARRRYDGRRKCWPTGPARVKWEISGRLAGDEPDTRQ